MAKYEYVIRSKYSIEELSKMKSKDYAKFVESAFMNDKPHGRCIDADALAEYYDNLEADNGVYTEQAGETADTIRNAPTVLEANNE